MLPRFWGATGTGPPAVADLRANDDRLVLTYTAVEWSPGDHWKAHWTMYPVTSRDELLASRADINRIYNQWAAVSAAQQPVAVPGGRADEPRDWREDLVAITAVGGLAVAAASALTAALGPGPASLYVVSAVLAIIGLGAFRLYVRRYWRQRWSAMSRRSRRLCAGVAAVVAVAGGVGVWLAVRPRLNWAAQADQICYDRGNQFLNAAGTPVQRARGRLAATQAALSELQSIEVPSNVRLRFNTVVDDHRQVIGYLQSELTLAERRRSTADEQGSLAGFYTDVYMPDAQDIGLRNCGQETGYQ